VSIPSDYDASPARYQLGAEVTRKYSDAATTPLHERIWQLLRMAAATIALRRRGRALAGGQVFARVRVEQWDAALMTLPDAAAARDYLVARFVPKDRAAAAAARLRTPLAVTKRGALLICSR
jgi:hypothetical protein